ncbi:hypothetical protein ACFW1D_24090 [Priestia megaterium]|uniref:hypothetical protein n=1 Tax=Priestia megaterium TaxID=1404 RepID=UPI00366DAB91
MKQIFLYRDPRDIVVSFVYYIMNDFQDDPTYSYLAKCTSQKERYLSDIKGMDLGIINYPNISKWLEKFMGWREHTDVHVVRFKDLIDPELQRRTVSSLATFIFKGQKGVDL